MMKLYVFDSCPYCLRVRALIGLKDIPCDIEYVEPGLPPAELEDKITTFRVPLLSLPAHANQPLRVLQESGDILSLLDRSDRAPLFTDSPVSPALADWIADARPAINALCYPRMPMLPLPELASASARDYFVRSRGERLGMPLTQALTHTDQWLGELQTRLARLNLLLAPVALLRGQRSPTLDDLYAFAELRNLSMVRELKWPGRLGDYLFRLSALTRIALYPGVSQNAGLTGDIS